MLIYYKKVYILLFLMFFSSASYGFVYTETYYRTGSTYTYYINDFPSGINNYTAGFTGFNGTEVNKVFRYTFNYTIPQSCVIAGASFRMKLNNLDDDLANTDSWAFTNNGTNIYSEPLWGNNAASKIININLDSLPNNNGSILYSLNDGRFSVYVQDDTSVEYVELKINIECPEVDFERPQDTEIRPCCPPWNEAIFNKIFAKEYQTGLSGNYRIRYRQTSTEVSQLNTRMQNYIDYLNLINPAINSITVHIRIGDKGTNNLPIGGNGSPVNGIGENFITWSAGGSGTPSNGGGNFWNSPFNLLPSHTYNLYSGTYLNDGNSFFSNSCANNKRKFGRL